jgi:hypothetical protein
MDISLNIRKRSFSGQYDVNKCVICQENKTDALEHKKQKGNSDPERTFKGVDLFLMSELRITFSMAKDFV